MCLHSARVGATLTRLVAGWWWQLVAAVRGAADRSRTRARTRDLWTAAPRRTPLVPHQPRSYTGGSRASTDLQSADIHKVQISGQKYRTDPQCLHLLSDLWSFLSLILQGAI